MTHLHGTPISPAGADTGTGTASITHSIARVRDAGDSTAGTGFLVAHDLVITCAHVVRAAGGGPGTRIDLEFPHLPGVPRTAARVQVEGWRPPDAEDIAVLRLEEPPAGSVPLALGSAEGCRGHRVRSFGFPAHSPAGGRYGFCTAGDLIPAGGDTPALMQLTDANDLTSGFSGAPVVDETTGLVIGMTTAITPQDAFLRGLDVAYATPTRTLREAWPQLSESRVSPYRGLEPFTEEHARYFHGREAVVEEALAVLERQRRVMLLLGPSGAGKSSLVRAGLLPALAEGRVPGSGRWLSVTARPGQDLTVELEAAGLPGAATEGIASAVGRRLAEEPSTRRLLVVIDQFEELFTGTPSGTASGTATPNEVLADIARQLVAVIDSDSAVSLILVMRDDYFARLATSAPDLLKAVTPGLFPVRTTLDIPELRAVIAEPARVAGAHLEEGLPERIISDVLAADPAAAADRKASATLLPALQLTLSRLWEDRRDGRLTHDAYQRLGGVAGSLTAWCEHALRGLAPELRLIAERILTALVRPADDVHAIPATRRQVSLDHLRALAADPAADGREGEEKDQKNEKDEKDDQESGERVDQDFDVVLGLLLERRIITTRVAPRAGGGQAPATAELVHDALIRDWGTLRDWVAADQEFQSWLHRTAERQARFAGSGQRDAGKSGAPDPGDLLDGTDLAAGLVWSKQRGLPEGIADFVATSRARRRAVARRARRIKVSLACVLTLAVIASGLLLWQRGASSEQARISTARNLVRTAEELRVSDPRLALQLGLAAYRLETDEPTTRATRASLLETLTTSSHVATLDGLGTEPTSLALSPDGRMLAAGGADGSVRFWDTSRPEQPTFVWKSEGSAGASAVSALAWRPDSKVLASGNSKELTLWSTGRAADPVSLGSVEGFGAAITSAVWTADGHRLALANYFNSYLMDIGIDSHGAATADVTAKIKHGGNPEDEADRLALSADGDLLITSDGKDSVQLWDTAGTAPHKAGAPLPLSDDLGPVTSVALSADDRTVALGTPSGRVAVWNIQDPRHPKELEETSSAIDVGLYSGVRRVRFISDGVLACVGDDGRVQLVRLDTVPFQRTDMPLVHGAAVNTMFADVSHHLLATGGVDGRVLLWNTADRERPRRLGTPLAGHATGSTTGELTAGGTLLASSATDGKTLLWDVGRPDRARSLEPVVNPGPGLPEEWRRAALGSALSPDGDLLATAGGERLTDVVLRRTNGGKTRQQGSPLRGHEGVPQAYGWSPDGSLLATGDFKGKVILWDTTDAERVVRRAELTHPAALRLVSFAQSTHTLLTVGTDGKAVFWNVPTGSGHPTKLSTTDIGQIGNARSSFALSTDGRLLVVGHSTADLSLWDVSDVRRPSRLSHLATEQDGPVGSVAVSPDRSVLAAGIGLGTVLLWDLTDPGRPRRMGPALHNRLPMPLAMAFLPDGRTLVSQTITQLDLWDLSPSLTARNDLPRRACARLADAGLSPSAWKRYAGATEYVKSC
ncbi:trypsin-like peptidase domain-containing protein [Streptomyces sp. NPDC052127]|uniref:nSTAND1 domain-containing NTPase n=1 Tax=Streptomyces sp. NPDC052127 TaxID=3155679 RepID=UPI003446373E